MPTTTFYDATVDGWKRIAKVYSVTDEGREEAYREYDGKVIRIADLPGDFVYWRAYTQHADSPEYNETVIFSQTGE